jgi:hypothetical protein
MAARTRGQKHGHQRSIQVPYQRLAGAREQRSPAVAKGSTAPEVGAWCAVVFPARNAEQRVERPTQQQVEDWG